MRFHFADRFYEISDPVPMAGEKLVYPKFTAIIPTQISSTEKMFRFYFPIQKLLFFFIREGIQLTLKKIKATRLIRVLLNEQQVIFATGKNEKGEAVIAIGPQPVKNSTAYLFPDKCTMTVKSDRDVRTDYVTVCRYFVENPEKLTALTHHSPFSGIPLDVDLTQILSRSTLSWLDTYTKNDPFLSVRSKCSVLVKPNPRNGSYASIPDLFLAGAGVYSYTYILPMLRNVSFHTVMDRNPALAGYLGNAFGFLYWDTSCERGVQRLKTANIPILIIATYHSTHVPIVETALSVNTKTRILVEKPPVTTFGQLEKLIRWRKAGYFIEIGYNRRYAPMIRKAKYILSQRKGPITMTCIVREKSGTPLSHWYYWPTQGTRITGNLSHWIDLGVHIIAAKPIAFGFLAGSKEHPADEPAITVTFDDGSMLVIIGSDRGNNLRGIQEFIDIRQGDLTIRIDDLNKMEIQKRGYRKIYRSVIRDKGHARMYREFRFNCKVGEEPKYPLRDLYISSKLYLDITDAALNGVKYCELHEYDVF